MQGLQQLTSGIRALGLRSRWRDAVQSLSELRPAGVEPDTQVTNAALSACRWRVALVLLGQLLAQGRVSVVSCTCAVSWCQGLGLFAEVAQRGLEVNEVVKSRVAKLEPRWQSLLELGGDLITCNTVLKQMEWPKNLQVLERIRCTLAADVVSWSTLLATSSWAEAAELVERMEGAGRVGVECRK